LSGWQAGLKEKGGEMFVVLILKLIKILPPRPQTGGHPSFE
jgi:hypothetical protein